jgi:hypothetical protein
MRYWLATVLIVVLLGAVAWVVPDKRRELVHAITTYDAVPTAPAPLPGGVGPPLMRSVRTRVVLIDGLAKSVARTLPHWDAACLAGMRLEVDVGFPTVSLPVEMEIWTGLTQQQSGIVYRSSVPLLPPLDKKGIPAQVPGSVAVAEAYGYIVRSLGFSIAMPVADPSNPAKDRDLNTDAKGPGWADKWQGEALAAVRGNAPLVFVHILRVDTAGHQYGIGIQYEQAAREADTILGTLMAADPTARWFLLSDHGHLPTGGHGGEEVSVRQVEHCIVGPGISPSEGGPIHVIDIARAIADSVGATLPTDSRSRPLSIAMHTPLQADQAIPPLALGAGAFAIFIIVAGLALSSWGVRRWWLVPWWFFAAVTLLIAIRGMPTLSMPMIYKPEGRDMYLTWLPALPLAFAAAWFSSTRISLTRMAVAQLALPVAIACAAIAASGAWPTLFGEHRAPVVPVVTAWASPLMLLMAHGAAAVALGVLASGVRRAFGPPAAPAPASTAPADA